MLYWRGDLRYIFIVARHQYTWIRDHLDIKAQDYQCCGKQLKKPPVGVMGESWEWTIEEGGSLHAYEPVSSKRSTRFNKRAA